MSDTMPAMNILGPGAPKPTGLNCRDVASRRRQLYELLGDLPDRQRPISAKTVRTEKRDGYILEKLELDLNGIEAVPAYLARPEKLNAPAPVILYNHAHGGAYDIGKEEFIAGRKALQQPPYAKIITEHGWIGLCIDTWVFGERAHTSELDMFKAMLWQGRVLWGMMVYDNIRALDYLIARSETDPERIATMGISMGSTMAWWTAALDERIKVTVDLCCLTEFHTFLLRNALTGHGIYYYVPGLLKSFTTADINVLIAPRPHLGIAGIRDNLTPPDGLDIIDAEMKRAYAELGAAENWKLIRYDVGHEETADARREVIEFLKQTL
ncbi:MAG TPA: alpha/beta hydrolase family protein [Candidatus Brocadiia bacterium]|nr:alpha/beta hydrolase family protein [Candidatus Brocadiia bacterium]